MSICGDLVTTEFLLFKFPYGNNCRRFATGAGFNVAIFEPFEEKTN
ncbi:MAG: hypothetical protein SVJ22_01960 [Halobacteriota archaeon]|nr:hypothetical protein [Halobacteriota archaeon]